MTEEEKIFAGKLFDARTKELRDIKHKAHILCQKFNQMDEYDPARLPIIREFIGEIGEKMLFSGADPVQLRLAYLYRGELLLQLQSDRDGRRAHLHRGQRDVRPERVADGDRPSADRARAHDMRYPDGHVSMSEFAKDIHIGSNVWLAANVVVLGGVTIGDGAVIGAGSVVTKDIPAGYLAVGVPCRPLRPITGRNPKCPAGGGIREYGKSAPRSYAGFFCQSSVAYSRP